MKNISNINERILYLIKNQYDDNQKKFAESIGYSAQVVFNIVSGRKSSPSFDVLNAIISTNDNINSEWLLTGKGPIEKSNTTYPEIESSNSIVNEVSNTYAVTPTKKEGIPLIPIEAMAGYGAGETQILELDCEYFSVPTFKGADFLIQVKGSSMYPKYNSGDIVACKKLMRDDVFFQWNKVYVIDTEQGALIKRIDIGADDDHVMIVSDNEKYKPFALHKSKINAISIVMGVIRLE